jgi:hypothetical protein
LREQAKRDREAAEEALRRAEREEARIAEAAKEAEEARLALQAAEQRLAEIRSRIDAQEKARKEARAKSQADHVATPKNPTGSTSPAAEVQLSEKELIAVARVMVYQQVCGVTLPTKVQTVVDYVTKTNPTGLNRAVPQAFEEGTTYVQTVGKSLYCVAMASGLKEGLR